MTRRAFAGALAGGAAAAQKGPPREERVEQLTARAAPAVALNHLGFLPRACKTVVVRAAGQPEFAVRDIGSPPQPFRLTRPLRKTPAS